MTRDAWFVMPGREGIEARARQWGVGVEEAAGRMLAQREALLQKVQEDRLNWGFVPDIWLVGWALLDLPWVPEGVKVGLARRMGMPQETVWETFKVRMRKCLGFDEPVRDLLVNGANGSGKSNFGAATTQLIAAHRDDAMCLWTAQQWKQSAITVQPRLWMYHPTQWRGPYRGDDWYVTYKELKGYGNAEFQLPTGTKVLGRVYSQDPKDALVGCDAHWAWADELVPMEWMEELGVRVARKHGQTLLTFTPLDGYTPVVKSYQDGMTVVRTRKGYMLPRDGGDQEPWRELGLTLEEYRRLPAQRKNMASPTLVPECRPEDCLEWMGERSQESGVRSQETAGGRVWEEVPRVARCRDPRRAVLWFQAGDNPYASPQELLEREKDKPADRIKTVVYGVAVKTRSAIFVRWDEGTHVVDAAPTGRANYHLIDPAGDRNWFMLWMRTSAEADYVYREWPGNYVVPGVGVPGPWAKTSGRNKGINDGDRDEGQKSFGFTLLDLKFEIARLERWGEYVTWERAMKARGEWHEDARPDPDELRDWTEDNAQEPVEARYIDSRAATAPRQLNDLVTTLQSSLDDLGVHCELAPGEDIDGGLKLIEDALGWERDGDVWVRRPRLYVARECVNTRFAMASYMKVDGPKGACKDPVDLIRYFYAKGLALGASLPLGRRPMGPRAGAGGWSAPADDGEEPTMRVSAGGRRTVWRSVR